MLVTSTSHRPNVLKKKVSYGGVSIICAYSVSKAWWDASRKWFIVLMEFFEKKSAKRFHNLVAYDFDNNLIWEAELPTDSDADCYTDAEVEDDTLSAFSFSGYRCMIDVETGRILSSSFTK